MYIIKNIGMKSEKDQIRILRCFQDDNDEIFSPYELPILMWMKEDEINALVENGLEVISEDYFEPTFYIQEKTRTTINNKIKKILKGYIEKTTNTQCDCLKKMMENVILGNFKGLDNKTIYDIKHMICYELLVNDYDKDMFNKMKKRKVFESRLMFDEYGKHENDRLAWWVAVDSDEELWSRVMHDNFGEGMVVTDRNKAIECFNYAFVYVETAEDYDLHVHTGENDNFEKNVVPQIANINLDIVKNIQKK